MKASSRKQQIKQNSSTNITNIHLPGTKFIQVADASTSFKLSQIDSTPVSGFNSARQQQQSVEPVHNP